MAEEVNESRRLVDYFVVIGFDESRERNGVSVGRVIQRFPTEEWPDVPFFHGLEVFCQPQGWVVRTEHSRPQFFISALTNVEGHRHYAACLSFWEPRFSSEPSSTFLADDDDDLSLPPSVLADSNSAAILYSPKCLVLVSRHHCFETFRDCLSTIYTMHLDYGSVNLEERPSLESVVATLVAGLHMPPYGGPLYKFSLGAGDRQAVQPPSSPMIPPTASVVALLFKQLGTIHNVLCLFCAVLTDKKILLHSTSYRRLSDACYALSALVYPLKYSYVYVPLLPETALEVLDSPTPFIMGVHSSLKAKTCDYDLIAVDLDCGSVFVPDQVNIPSLPEPYYSRLLNNLTLVLNPSLHTADLAFQSSLNNNNPRTEDLVLLDKQIRACFVRLFAHLFTQYRTCLQVVRLHSRPYISFHRAAFLGLRGFLDDEFMTRLIDGMSFQSFVTERGSPYRICDLFDEICANFQDVLDLEGADRAKISLNIQTLAQQLLANELSTAERFLPSIPEPSEQALSNPAPPCFPALNEKMVGKCIEEIEQKNLRKTSSFARLNTATLSPIEVPVRRESNTANISMSGPDIRRLDVLKNCLHCIFESRVADARKMLSAVLLSMKSQAVRVAFCQELHNNLYPQNRATLEPQQFDLIIRLMNCALTNESDSDEHGIAYSLLSLSNTYCRRLTPGILQFAYTCIQDHQVWTNLQFWEAVFFHDIHRQMRQLYLPRESRPPEFSYTKSYPFGKGASHNTWNLFEEPSALRLVSDRLKILNRTEAKTVAERQEEEESIVFGQAVHYTNLIVCMRTPLDASRLRRVNLMDLERQSQAGSRVTHSNGDSDTDSVDSDGESGFVEEPIRFATAIDSDVGQGTVRWITKFLDKVCSEAGLEADQLNRLHQRIPGFLAMHIENLEQVYRESKRLPPIHKPKLLVPVLLAGERILQGHLRVFLLPDGRDECARIVERTHGCNLLPAEGALFLTNYRVIFKGQPCDPYICEQVVVRSLPIMSMTKDKRIGQQLVATGGTEQSSHHLHDALQIRSAVCQLIKVAFDEEVSTEKVETFCAALEQLRWPETVYELFALSAVYGMAGAVADMRQEKMKHATIGGFAKKTLLKTARKAGLAKPSSKKEHNKYVLANGRSPWTDKAEEEGDKTPRAEEMAMDLRFTLSRTLDKLSSREYARDYERLCLVSKADLNMPLGSAGRTGSPLHSRSEHGFRLSTVNKMYELCRSYPAAFIVPAKTTDDSLRKITKGHKHSRFPVVTWCSSGGALLLHGAGFHTKNVMSRLKKQAGFANQPGKEKIDSLDVFRMSTRKDSNSSDSPGASAAVLKSSLEQERYLASLVALSPSGPPLGHNSHLTSSMGSLLSMDSLMLTSLDTSSTGSVTPETQRKALPSMAGQIGRATANFVRSSGGRGMKTMVMSGRFGSLRPIAQRPASTSSVSVSSTHKRHSSYLSADMPARRELVQPQTLHRSSLYIFGERSQAKAFRLPQRCEFIPISYPSAHDAKAALKKFLRVLSPSAPPATDAVYSHLKSLDETGWLRQVKCLLQISSAIVDLMDIQNSSVAICLEDGWDASIQLSCLTQVMLDPYYRTLEGFRVLVEKEWLGFGHRFSHRCNHTLATANSGMAPIFMMFLDAVHQIQRQFPSAFEFNDFFLRYLAYHSVAGYFRTFLLDCEVDRIEAGLIFDGKTKPRPELTLGSSQEDLLADSGGGLPRSDSIHQQMMAPPASIWDVIFLRHRRSPLFYNFLYSAEAHTVLRAQFQLPSLDVWGFYFEDSLSHGCTYDLDAADVELQERQSDKTNAQDLIGIGRTSRKVVDLNYDDALAFSQPPCFQAVLEEIEQLEKDLDMLPRKWTDVLQRSQQQTIQEAELVEHVSVAQEWSRWLHRALHKKFTLDLLLRGRMATQQVQHNKGRHGEMETPHQFQPYHFTAPEYCQVCNRILWGVVVRHGLRCSVCSYSCHEKCAPVAPRSCTEQVKPDASPSQSAAILASSHQEKDVFSDSVESAVNVVRRGQETRTHEGALLKRGVRLKGWKARWFVLDSTMHQLRYYDSAQDSSCKGVIDLGEVQNVCFVNPPSVMPKRMEGAYFDLRTARRAYNFMAYSRQEADEWLEQIQRCLQ